MLLTSWSSMLLEQRMSVAQPFGWSCREVMQFPLSRSPGISGVKTSRLFLGERPVRKKGTITAWSRISGDTKSVGIIPRSSLTFSVRVNLAGVISLARSTSWPGRWCASIYRITDSSQSLKVFQTVIKLLLKKKTKTKVNNALFFF